MNSLVEEMGYETPQVKMITVAVENGFGVSGNGSLGGSEEE